MVNPKSWHLSSASICTGHSQKKIVLVLCIVTWAAIFFISGTLFIKRRYETDNQVYAKLLRLFINDFLAGCVSLNQVI